MKATSFLIGFVKVKLKIQITGQHISMLMSQEKYNKSS